MRTNFPSSHPSRQASQGNDDFRKRSGHLAVDDEDDGLGPYHEDPHTPQAIVHSYRRFERHISTLRHQLGLFLSECRQLGRSYALILAAKDVREGLENLLSKFHDNATRISPLLQDELVPSVGASTAASVESFPFWLEGVAEACENFRERLDEFREYTDESAKIKSLMGFFVKDLKYRASCLKEYGEKLDTDYMRCYIHDLADEMSHDLQSMTSAFMFFNEYGMPAMQYEQRRDTEIVLNMSTVATFFSAVAVTTLQMSFDRISNENRSTFSIVNTFLFGSLVLSIGAALNSLLAVAWKRTPYGSRGRRLPLWVTIWIHASAPVFLALSIASFSAGLVLFAYASEQEAHTKYVTLASTAITTFGLVTITAWFGYEQWVAPFLLPNAPWRPFIKRDHEWEERRSKKRPSRPALDHRRSRTGSLSLSEYSDGSTRTGASSFNIVPPMVSSRLPVVDLLNKVAALGRQEAREQSLALDVEHQPPRSPTAAQQRTRARWVHSAKLVTTLKSVTNVFKQGSPSTVTSPSAVITPDVPAPVNTDRLGTPLVHSVPDVPVLVLPHQHGLVQDLEYSPDGLFLATTSRDKVLDSSTTVIYTTSSNYAITSRYRHRQRWASKQVLWSPNSDKLLVRLERSIDFLDTGCNLLSTVRRPQSIESAAWLLSGFLSVERSTVFKMNMQGHVLAKYRFDKLLLRDITVIPNSNLLLVVGRVTHSRQEVLPSNSRAEKRLILFDMRTEAHTSRHPILDDVRYVQMAKSLSSTRNGYDILLSHKNRPSPKLWTLHAHLKGWHHVSPTDITLQPSLELTGHGVFVGEHDKMLACAGQDGDIHVWDRETGHPVHRIKAQAVNYGVRCFAWCPTSTTFAAVGKDGLKFWSIELVSENREFVLSAEPTRMPQIQPDQSTGGPGQSSGLWTTVNTDQSLDSAVLVS